MTTHTKGQRLMFERLVFFSDAVFAIAITLLVLDIKLPPGAHTPLDFGEIGPKVFGFFLSFAVIGVYWLNHHRLFGRLEVEDGPLRLVNLAFLASVAFLPFPTSVIAEYAISPVTVRFYALAVAAVGLLFVALILVARRPSLLAPDETLGGTVTGVCYASAAPLVFLASSVVAGARPNLAMQLWWLVMPAMLGMGVIGRWAGARIDQRRVRAPSEP